MCKQRYQAIFSGAMNVGGIAVGEKYDKFFVCLAQVDYGNGWVTAETPLQRLK